MTRKVIGGINGMIFGWGRKRAAAKAAADGDRAAVATFTPPWPQDDEIVANLAIVHLRDNLLRLLTGERGIHSETLMVVIGAIAGHAAAQAAHAAVASGKGALMQVATPDGQTLYFGDPLNVFLVPEDRSIPALWSFLAAAAIESGISSSELPNTDEIFGHVSKTAGTAAFGQLRTPQGHSPMWPPRECLDAFWPTARDILSWAEAPGGDGRSLSVVHWPVVVSLVAQQFVRSTRDVLDPRLSLQLIMESAIFMSKVDPKTVPQAQRKQS